MSLLALLAETLPLTAPEPKILLTGHYVNPGVLKRNLALKILHPSTGASGAPGLTQSPSGLANLHVRQAREFFVELAAPHFGDMTYVSGDRLFWRMFDLLQSLRDRLQYFAHAVQFSGICTLMIETIAELRLNSIHPDHLRSLGNEAKWDDVILIMEEYTRAKRLARLFDYADAVLELLKHPAPLPNTFIIKHHLSALEEDLVAKNEIRIIDPNTQDSLTYELSGYKVDTPYQEILQTIRNVMRDLNSAMVPVRIGVCTMQYNESFYRLTPVLEKLNQEGLVQFLKGAPLLSTQAGNLWKYFAEWVQHNRSVHRLLRILESPSYDRGAVDPRVFHQAVRYFRNSELVLCNKDFLSAFKEFLDGREPVDADEGREQLESGAADVALAIAHRFHTVAVAQTMKECLEAIRELFAGSVRIRSEADAAAVVRIEAVLDETSAAADIIGVHAKFEDVIGVITEKLDGMYVNVTLPDGTRPVLGMMNDLIYCEFDSLYILSLNEKSPSGSLHQNPVLLDDEKRGLRGLAPAVRMQLREDRLEEETRMFDLVKRTCTRRLVMSAPLKDLSTGREMLVSRYLLNEWNRCFGRHDDYGAVSAALGDNPASLNNYVPPDPEDSFYKYETAVAVHVRHQGTPLRRPLLADAFPFAEASAEFRRRRLKAHSFDGYWGVIQTDPHRDLPVMSATRIATWAKCPYQYFLKNELRLDREKEFDAHSLEWLDHLAYGSFLHELYYRFFVRLYKQNNAGFFLVDEYERHALREEFETLLKEFEAQHPVTSRFHYDETVGKLKRDMEGFFERECRNQDQRLFAELSFAMNISAGRDRLFTTTEPAMLSLSDGTQVFFRGAIDRVDRTREGRYVLIDYKSGKPHRPRAEKPFDGGELMQAGLYSEAAGQIDQTIADPIFKYYYATDQAGFSEYVVDYSKVRNHFVRFLTSIITEIRRGNFVPFVARKGEFPCSFCDYSAVCIEGKRRLGERLKAEDANHGRYKRITDMELES
jgi:ATP-dependent helicase/nuclease subunit B